MATLLINIVDIQKEHDLLTAKLVVLEARQGDLQRSVSDLETAIAAAQQAYDAACLSQAQGEKSADPGGALSQKDFLTHRLNGVRQLLAATTGELEPLVQRRSILAERIIRQQESDELDRLIATQQNAERNLATRTSELEEAKRMMLTAVAAVAAHRKRTELEQRRRERGQ